MQEFTVQLFDDGSAQISGTGANLELRFGYSKNAHMYSVKFIRSEEWEDLYIRVHFHPEADIYDVEPVLAQNNIVNIPAMITSMPGEGKLTIEGTDGYKTITSADIPYRVGENSGIDEGTDPEPGESSFQQFVDAVKKDAESATQAAKDAGDILKETKEAGTSALTDIETAKGNAISEIEKIEIEVKGEIQEDVESAKSSAEAAAKSAEEAKTAADSAKKSLSDLEAAKQSAISEISKEKDSSVSAVGSAKEAALNEILTSSDFAVKSVKTAETDAVNAVETEGSTQKTALNNASSAALTSIETAKTNAVKAVEDKASAESLAIDEKASQVITSVQNAGDAELLAIGQATNSSIEQITQNAGQHLTQIDSAADEAVTDIMEAKEDSLSELEAVNAHPPIQNPETGKWQVWNSETASYVDTEYDWEGGYYSASVDSEGNLNWKSSKEGMDDIPSSNIRGPQGLGVPTPTANDHGKAPTVNAAGTGYELTGPYAPLSAAIIETAKGNPAVCEDSVEWSLQGMRVYGKSTQVSTTGAQKISFPLWNEVVTRNGVTLTPTDSGFTVSGTASEITDFVSDNSFSLEENDYILSSCGIRVADVDRMCVYALSGEPHCDIKSDDKVSQVSHIPEGDFYILYRVLAGQTVNKEYSQIMLNTGSTALPYEPYTGGKPSPSPDYPQEIHSAGDEGEIDIGATGKNLLNNAGYQLTATNLRWGRDEGYNGIILKAHTQYTLSVNDSLPIPNAMYINYKPSNKTIYSKSNVRSITYTPEEDVLVSLDAVWDNGRPENATHFQLEIGSTATSYEPYQSQFLAFDTPDGLPGVPVSSGGNFVDSTGQEWICNYRDYDAEKDIKTIEYIANYNNESVGDIWMSTTGQLTVGASVLYALDTPIQSSIPADKLAAYRALHAYDGITVITPDDALAEVEVDYIVRPKAYIEKKLTAIESRLNALEISEALEGE